MSEEQTESTKSKTAEIKCQKRKREEIPVNAITEEDSSDERRTSAQKEAKIFNRAGVKKGKRLRLDDQNESNLTLGRSEKPKRIRGLQAREQNQSSSSTSSGRNMNRHIEEEKRAQLATAAKERAKREEQSHAEILSLLQFSTEAYKITQDESKSAVRVEKDLKRLLRGPQS